MSYVPSGGALGFARTTEWIFKLRNGARIIACWHGGHAITILLAVCVTLITMEC